MALNIGLFGNFVIAGTITTKEGLHIGAPKESIEIGGIDSPVIKHPITGAPYIPGSSLKGKMRSIIEKSTMASLKGFRYNRSDRNQKIVQHVCDDIEYSYNPNDHLGAIKCPVCRVYGSTGDNGGKNYPARILVRDCYLSDNDYLMMDEIYMFEAKTETAINRITAEANPRTIERVPEGAKFSFEIIYRVFCKPDSPNIIGSAELAYVKHDIKNIFEVLALIQRDSLGGNISRGSGKVEFTLDKDKCKYYKIGGGDYPLLPVIENELSSDLEILRQNDFSNINLIINPS
ncbi:MAG TPA: type III-A CRISPR-associated RAMP protein Csm3 [Ignavibacteriaceae bacterium]|nr:type III-A CRISPR-associated RAMP protein Csm3 [Ignavibacteriaceae bacterium]